MMQCKRYFKLVGPGLLYAGAAVGVSHLVQSTRAGAGYGFQLVWVVVLANILKYPFFEIAPRSIALTGKTLLQGYRELGSWALVLFMGASLLGWGRLCLSGANHPPGHAPFPRLVEWGRRRHQAICRKVAERRNRLCQPGAGTTGPR